MIRYQLHALIPANLVGDIIDLLNGEGIVVSLEPEKGSNQKITRGFVNGKRIKDISGLDLVLNTLEAAPNGVTTEQLEGIFVKHGFAPKSAPSTASKLVKQKKVKRVNDRYLLNK